MFLETVVLTSLRRCGQPTLTVFNDAQCAAESFACQAPVLDGLGVRYRVVPVEMDPGFRFHPKAVLLSGPKRGALFIGSGNLTFGGWRENAEVWLHFDTADDGSSALMSFYTYLQEILERLVLPDAVRAEVAEAFDPKTKSWVSEMAPSKRLISRCGRGDALLARILDVIGDAPVDRLFVCAPYFDEDGTALAVLLSKSGAASATVLCQPERSTLTKRAWSAVKGRRELLRVSFRHSLEGGQPRKVFVHAKFYSIQRGDDVTVIGGSANCSRAALTVSGNGGNAELLAVQRLSLKDFEQAYLEELTVDDEEADLPDKIAREEPSSIGAALRVLAARYEGRSLVVAYAPANIHVTECIVDGTPQPFEEIKKGTLHVPSQVAPRTVALVGAASGKRVTSASAWVDHERELRSTARGRSLADAIRSRLLPGEWNVGAWAETLDVLCKHLQYMPARVTGHSQIGKHRDGQDENRTLAYTADDVFASDYHIPSLGALTLPVDGRADRRIRSLQQLLLRWFGMLTFHTGDGSDDATNAGPEPDARPDDLDEPVDRPEALPDRKFADNDATTVVERDRRRIQKLLAEIARSMTSREFLSDRPPELLATDLKVAAVLLRVGLREGWIDDREFFQLTYRVWSALFLSSEVDPKVGWIEYRYRTAEDPQEFIAAMRSSQLTAALVGWTFAVPRGGSTAEYRRFILASALAVARLPWLWDWGGNEESARELAELLVHTAKDGQEASTLEAAQAHWGRLVRQGHALQRFERAVRGLKPSELGARVRQPAVEAGELLWQGRDGFAVVTRHCPRKNGHHVGVLPLQGAEEEAKYVASYTIPVRALLEEDIVPVTESFGDPPRRELLDLLDTISKGFCATGAKASVPPGLRLQD